MAADINHPSLPTHQSGLLHSDAPQTLPRGGIEVSTWMTYAYNPLVYRYQDGTYDPLLAHAVWLTPSVGVGLLPRLDMAAALPVVLHQGGGVANITLPDGPPNGTGLGDTRLSLRYNVLPERILAVGLAAAADLTLPTGSERLLSTNGIGVRPRLIASLPVGSLQLLGTVAYAWSRRQTLEHVAVGDRLELSAGARLPLWAGPRPLLLLAELAADTSMATPFSGGSANALVAVGAAVPLGHGFEATAGLDWGLARGLGTPAVRLLGAVMYRTPQTDGDGDGVPDGDDACPSEPEDYNRYADLDGCPDAHQAPPPDRDGDGLPDGKDSCPDQPEDKDGVLDADGCPDVDDDRDGIPDPQDRCPLQAETINGFQDDDGCPDVGESDVSYERSAIEIKRIIQFETGRSVIKSESFTVLDQVALLLLAHPEILSVRVEGHTDSQGKPEANLRLSQARAEAVRTYLVERGVAPERLLAQGFGQSQPLESNDNAQGRANNRRVAFVVLQTGGVP